MLKKYFDTSIKNLSKHKLYSAIDIGGLAIGLAACIVMSLYVQNERSYDKHWRSADNLYRVNYTIELPGAERNIRPITPLALIPILNQYSPDDIERSSRARITSVVFKVGDNSFEENRVLVDRPFIDMFDFEVLSGSLEQTLSDPNNVALSAEVATRYFGNRDPVGEVIPVTFEQGLSGNLRVSAVYRIPGNSTLYAPLISLLDETILPSGMLTNWRFQTCFSYIQLRPGADIEAMKALTPNLLDQNVDISSVYPDANVSSASAVLSLDFQNVKDIYLDSPWDNVSFWYSSGNKMMVMTFSVIAVLVLLIACINFIILTTAKATQRAREVAMRKVLGAHRKQLIFQFLGESLLTVTLAMIIALGLVELLLPVFEAMVSRELALNYFSPGTYLSLLALLLMVGVSGGYYPALILSGFRPSATLKSNRSSETKSSLMLRNVLVVFQFSVSIALIISTCVIHAQIQHSNSRDLGFNRENVLGIYDLRRGENVSDKLETLKQELLSQANITDVALSYPPGDTSPNYALYQRADTNDSYSIVQADFSYDYLPTYQIAILAGRNFSLDQDIPEPLSGSEGSDDNLGQRSIILNASAVRAMGFANPESAVGSTLSTSDAYYTVIGVIADTFSINEAPQPVLFRFQPVNSNYISIRFQGSPQTAMEQINSSWKKVIGDKQMYTMFVDQQIAAELEEAQTQALMLTGFSLLAIIIACMGLYGSTSFTVERRTKEIGLRKVMGATVKNVVSLLIWQFSKPVLLANLIAWPVAIWVMINWLQRFAYQINHWLLLPLCIAAGLAALSIAWATVISSTTRVATNNPIKALRHE
jgi:putative ABC transport system permease protein